MIDRIEVLKGLRSSQGWEALVIEIDDRIELEVGKLKFCQPEALLRIQERIRAWEELKRLPTDVIEREEQ